MIRGSLSAEQLGSAHRGWVLLEIGGQPAEFYVDPEATMREFFASVAEVAENMDPGRQEWPVSVMLDGVILGRMIVPLEEDEDDPKAANMTVAEFVAAAERR